MSADSELADRISAAILATPEAGDPDRPHPDHLLLVKRAAQADRIVGGLLAQSVSAARASGHSWAAIGAVLGLSRQAVQQRFGGAANAGHIDAPRGSEQPDTRTRKLGPVTAFDEMPELELAGRQGWRTIGVGMYYHLVERTETQWETKRVIWSKPAHAYEQDGWVVAVRAFPWLYLVRDLGVPAEIN